MKKLQLFQLLFPFIILKLSEEMDPTNKQNAFKKYVRSQEGSDYSSSWQQPDSQGASSWQQSDTFMNTHPYSQVVDLY